MKKVTGFLCLVFVISAGLLQAQNYGTRAGKISFYSDTPIEKIEAHNESVSSILDAKTGGLQFTVQIKGFQFAKVTMKDHFNDNYMESGKYPSATFKGTITNINQVDFAKDGSYPVTTKGTLTIHGVSKEVETKGKVDVKNGVPTISSSFNVLTQDYNIKIPATVRDSIAKTILIKVNCVMNKM